MGRFTAVIFLLFGQCLCPVLATGNLARQATATKTFRSRKASIKRRSMDSTVTPLSKVLQLLDKLYTAGVEEKHAEEVGFTKFREWCQRTMAATTKDVDDAASDIGQLKADMAKAQADAEELAGAVEDLQASINKKTVESEEAKQLREKERKDYAAIHLDLEASIDAVGRAIRILKAKSKDVPQSLAQVQNSPSIPEEAKSIISGFLETQQGAAPEPNAYEFQSKKVVDLLQELLGKFKRQKQTLEKEEASKRHSYELLNMQLTDDLKAQSTAAREKTAAKARRLQDKSAAELSLKQEEAGRAEDKKKYAETRSQCKKKSEMFEKNQVTRSDELKAMRSAINILRSAVVKAAERSSSFQQEGARRGIMVQLGYKSKDPLTRSDAREKAVAMLQSAAKQTGSKYLALVATHLESDPFAKVKKMIQDMLDKLLTEASTEADKKAYCDAELGKSKLTREKQQSEVEQLTAAIEKKSADSAQAAAKLQDLSSAVTELRKEQKTATEMRRSEKARNTQTIKEAKQAQLAVQKAIEVLKSFYGKAAEDSSFLQADDVGEEMLQEATGTPYAGMQSQKDGVLGLLEVIVSDFARLDTTTSSAEDQAQKEYDQFLAESSKVMAVKEAEIAHTENDKRVTDGVVQDLKEELELTQSELAAASKYEDKLKSECRQPSNSYEERKSRRKENVAALKEALEMLSQ
eukprot:CAMPEP_0172683912 /NCGR_PEP_ID=MMETSP1074-20121228/19188_1 /TAXON_ID=2916 /ORGANISM="Ceratium fusus, Strain PA161109" /LENGTH=692 /DNA_ID=CAMNT_0013502831 /DNA_START=121 /DNA_END=2199 /DNA_ORIENTATION=+